MIKPIFTILLAFSLSVSSVYAFGSFEGMRTGKSGYFYDCKHPGNVYTCKHRSTQLFWQKAPRIINSFWGGLSRTQKSVRPVYSRPVRVQKMVSMDEYNRQIARERVRYILEFEEN